MYYIIVSAYYFNGVTMLYFSSIMVARKCEHLAYLNCENKAMQAFYYTMEDRQCEQKLSPLKNSTV